jgi:hypothetical protein
MDPAPPVVAKPTLDSLIEAGFQRVGTWRATTRDRGMELDFVSDRAPGVYAYAVDGVIHYIGSAQRGLHSRFRRYAITTTLRTSARIRSEILDCLARGQTVEIYTLCPPSTSWRGLPVDLIAGIEEGLIRHMRPAWNRRSNREPAA